jgi:hypothetical protein
MSGYTPPSLPPQSSPSIILVDDERDILSACLPSSCKGKGIMMSMHFLTLQRQLTLLQIQTRFCSCDHRPKDASDEQHQAFAYRIRGSAQSEDNI